MPGSERSQPPKARKTTRSDRADSMVGSRWRSRLCPVSEQTSEGSRDEEYIVFVIGATGDGKADNGERANIEE